MIDHGVLNVSNKFRMKKSKPKLSKKKRYESVEPHTPVLTQTVGKQ